MSSYLITGATGYIGSQLVKKFYMQPDAEITAIVRDVDRAREMLPDMVRLIRADITDEVCMGEITGTYDYVVHCAATTQSAKMVSHPVETSNGIVLGTKNVMDAAYRCGAKSVVYLSSMEVYGDIDCRDGHRVRENEMGTVDLYRARSCYPMGKRMAENLCFSYYKEYGVPVKIARLAQTFGSGVLPSDGRVFAQFARAAINGEDIILHTAGESMGNYCGISDVLTAIELLLEYGENGQAYNVVNEENTMKIRDMAELVATRIAHGRIKVRYQILEDNRYGYAADTGLRLSAEKLRGLGWKPVCSLETMYLQLIETFTVL